MPLFIQTSKLSGHDFRGHSTFSFCIQFCPVPRSPKGSDHVKASHGGNQVNICVQTLGEWQTLNEPMCQNNVLENVLKWEHKTWNNL